MSQEVLIDVLSIAETVYQQGCFNPDCRSATLSPLKWGISGLKY